MTSLSDHLRTIAEGQAARKVLFDEYAPAERNLPEALQGIADAIEEEADSLAKPSSVTQVDVDAAAERVEREWTDWARTIARGIGVDVESLTWEEVQSAIEGAISSLRDDVATVGTSYDWRCWADDIAAMLGVATELPDTHLRNAVRLAVKDLVRAALFSMHDVPSMPVPWPMFDDGTPVTFGDTVRGRTVDRVVVVEGWYKLYDKARHVLASGVTGESVQKPDSIERVMADLSAMGFEESQLEQLTVLVERAAKVGGR